MDPYGLASKRSELNSLKSKLGSLDKSLSNLVEAEQTFGTENSEPIRAELETSVLAMRSTWDSLQALEPPALDEGDGDDDGEDDNDDTALQSLRQHVAAMSSSVDKLTLCTSRGLKRASELKQQSTELATTAQSLALQIEAVQQKVDRALSSAKTSKDRAAIEYQNKAREYNVAVSELGGLEAELEDKRDNRNLLRAGRAIVWTTSLFLPAVAVVGAGMEYGAHKLQNKIDNLKSRKWRCESDMNDAKGQMNSLNSRISELSSTANTAQGLANICDGHLKQVREELDRSRDMERRLHGLDDAAQHMTLKLRQLQDRTILMVEFDEDRRILEDAVRDFVRDVTDGGQSDLAAICQPLVKLLE